MRRRLIVGATATVLAVAAWASGFPGRLDGTPVGSSPRPSSVASPAASAALPPASAEASATAIPSTSTRAIGPLGAANDAVVVRPIGDLDRPDLEVSLVTLDAGAFETNLQPRLIARLPASSIPANSVLGSHSVAYGLDGWLAVDVVAVASIAQPSMLIYDLRAPDDPPWQVPGRVSGASWGPDSLLAVAGGPDIQLYDPARRSVSSVAIPSGVTVRDSEADADAPVTWTAEAQGFLAWQGTSERQFGRLDLNGDFAPSELPPAVFQARGLERQWAGDGSELGYVCPADGGPEGCSISRALGGGLATVWFTEGAGEGTVMDRAWDASGDGIWLLLEHVGGEGPVTYTVAHADAPNDWLEVASTVLDQPGDGGLRFLGIRDAAATLDDRHVLIGPPGAYVQVAVSGDGSIASFGPETWFAGWAADQGPYPSP